MPFRQNMKNQKIEATISGMLMASKGKQGKALKVNEIKSAFSKLNDLDKAMKPTFCDFVNRPYYGVLVWQFLCSQALVFQLVFYRLAKLIK